MHPKHFFFSKKNLLQWAILIDLSPKTFSTPTPPPPKKKKNFLSFFYNTQKTTDQYFCSFYNTLLFIHKKK